MNTPHPRNIIVTGASRGIGELTVQVLAQRGHDVFAGMRDIAGRNADAAQRMADFARDHGLSITCIELDVTSQQSCRLAADQVLAHGGIDVLVNNAGIMPVGLTEGFSIEAAKALFDVNMFGAAAMSQAVLPAMRKQGNGLLIHISSSAGRLAIPYFGLYCASKFALEAYAESLHYELQPFGIESVLVEPSGHATDLVATSPRPDRSAIVADYGAHAAGGEKLLGMFHQLFDQQLAGNDARNVAERIAGLVDMDQPRPLRTQVGDDMGVTAINDAVAPIQSGLIAQLAGVYAAELEDA